MLGTGISQKSVTFGTVPRALFTGFPLDLFAIKHIRPKFFRSVQINRYGLLFSVVVKKKPNYALRAIVDIRFRAAKKRRFRSKTGGAQ